MHQMIRTLGGITICIISIITIFIIIGFTASEHSFPPFSLDLYGEEVKGDKGVVYTNIMTMKSDEHWVLTQFHFNLSLRSSFSLFLRILFPSLFFLRI